jgi:hypothetical protein
MTVKERPFMRRRFTSSIFAVTRPDKTLTKFPARLYRPPLRASDSAPQFRKTLGWRMNMKKTLRVAALLLALCATAFAGDINQPPLTDSAQPTIVEQVVEFVATLFVAAP